MKEIGKQLVDQSLHVLIAAASVWIIGWPLQHVVDIVVSVFAAGVLTFAWIAYREVKQWPSDRWYDPPLDGVFWAVGLGLGCWTLASYA